MRRHSRRDVWAALVLVLAVVVLPLGGSARPAAAATPAFTQTKTVSRVQLNADGTDTVIDRRTVTVTVSQTANLRGRQQIDVAWSGARPTAGTVADPNSANARLQEYPFVVMECRGVDSTTAPAGARLDPTTCWTQTPDERFAQDYNTAFPAWRVDRYATPAERESMVNGPSGADAQCLGSAKATRFVPFTDAAGKRYYWGGNGVCGLPPEGSTAPDPKAPPADTAYGITNRDGTGRTKFAIWTAQENTSLGCSDTVACALVIIPIMGISCDVTGAGLPAQDQPTGDDATTAAALCQGAGSYNVGDPLQQGKLSYAAVAGSMWWSASNWRNRITVPLTFAPPANLCDVLDTSIPVDIYGSELMNQATAQWAPAFCRDSNRFHFRHVRVGEPQAKQGLATGSMSAALISRPPDGGYTKPTVTAPVGVTGFAVSYMIDDQNQHEVAQLKLNARLLAKLLAESYYAFPALHTDYVTLADPTKTCTFQCAYAALKSNPQDLIADPEFRKLNPGLLPGGTVQHEAAATLLALSGDSDVIYALTSYINADPDARAWLNGKADPWGMVVNPAYRGMKLPVGNWPLLDDFRSPDFDLSGCLPWNTDPKGNKTYVQQPILPLVANPMVSLTAIVQAMEFALDNTPICVPTNNPSNPEERLLDKHGRQSNGFRLMIGINSVADANFYGVRTASLQSSPGNFVAPSDASMKAAVRLATYDTTTGYWPMPYAKLRATAGAYPGTMVVYLAVPTTGLDTAKDAKGRTLASKLAQLLAFAAVSGQQPGVNQGQLPTGYLPITAANGLALMAAYTLLAAVAVERQLGEIIVPIRSGGGASGGGSSRGSGGTGTGGSGSTPNGGSAPSLTTSRAPDLPAWQPGLQLPRGYTSSVRSPVAAWALPVLVLVGVLAAALAVLVAVIARARATASISARLRRLAERNGR